MDVRRGWSRKDYIQAVRSHSTRPVSAMMLVQSARPTGTFDRRQLARPFSLPPRSSRHRHDFSHLAVREPFHFFNLVFLNFFFSLSLPPLFPFLFLLSRNGKRSQGISRGEGYRAWWNVPRAVSSWIIRFQFRLEVAAVGENRDGEMIRCSSLWELEREREKMCPRWGRAANFFDSLTSPYDFLIPPYSFFLSFFFSSTLSIHNDSILHALFSFARLDCTLFFFE